jgi:hypothetical protein
MERPALQALALGLLAGSELGDADRELRPLPRLLRVVRRQANALESRLLAERPMPEVLGVLDEEAPFGRGALASTVASPPPKSPFPPSSAMRLARRQRSSTFPANVVLGNPSWRGRSEKRGPWIADLVADYYRLDGALLGEKNPKILAFRRIASALTFTLEVQEKIAEAGGGYGDAS